MSDVVWLAVIGVMSVVVTGTLSPMLLARQINASRRLEKIEDWKRQDEVAARLLASNAAIAAATRVTSAQLVEVAAKVEEVHIATNSLTDRLVASTEKAADATGHARGLQEGRKETAPDGRKGDG